MNDQKSTNQRHMAFKPQRNPALSLADSPRKNTTHERGSDPYNTSGSFDRKKNWARVGRR
jgi:hypothetical protein